MKLALLIPLFFVVSGFEKIEQDESFVLSKRIREACTPELVRGYEEYLASDELGGRFTGSEDEKKATELIAKVFKEAGLKPAGDSGAYFQNFEINRRSGEAMIGRNCVGLLEGTDPILKNEYIVVGAHHDHVGNIKSNPAKVSMIGKVSPGDGIFNGADDNASGTSTVLAIVNTIGKLGFKSKRSIIFMTYSGEELGLLGSAHYVKNPIADIKKHIAMINLDMVGANKGSPITALCLASDEGEFLENMLSKNAESFQLQLKISASMSGGSDHVPFIMSGVPAAFFFSGFHPRYHTELDHHEFMDYERMAKTAQCVISVLNELGNRDAKPVFDPKSKDALSYRGPMLGIMPDEMTDEELAALKLGEKQGAIKIKSVSRGSVADECGMKKGDYIVRFKGDSFPRDGTLMRLNELKKEIKFGEQIPIVVVRDGSEHVLLAVWHKPRRLGFYPVRGELTENEIKNLRLGDDEGAIAVDSLVEGSVADKIGLKPGDYILSINGQALPRADTLIGFQKILRGVRNGFKVPIVVARGDERVTLEAVWEE